MCVFVVYVLSFTYLWVVVLEIFIVLLLEPCLSVMICLDSLMVSGLLVLYWQQEEILASEIDKKPCLFLG